MFLYCPLCADKEDQEGRNRWKVWYVLSLFFFVLMFLSLVINQGQMFYYNLVFRAFIPPSRITKF